MEHISGRGTGRTTQQIKTAPFQSAYVCKTHGFIRYCEYIADCLGRKDIKFLSLDQVRGGYLRGWSHHVVLDHDCAASVAHLLAA